MDTRGSAASFVRNQWYLAAWEEQVTKPVRRVIAGTPVVVYRGQSESWVALEDICPHRGVPLSMGHVVGDCIECCYHGLRFDSGGICVHNPHVKTAAGSVRVRSFPCVSHQKGIWVWMGEANAAAKGAPPVYPEFDDPSFAVVRGYLHIKSDYRLIIDNLLDLSHAQYIHAGSLGIRAASSRVDTRMVRTGDGVTIERKVHSLSPSPMFAAVWSQTGLIDQVSNVRWRSPALLDLDVFVTKPGGTREGALCLPSLHLLTPETDSATHYFWSVGRNFRQDDADYSTTLAKIFAAAFVNEDAPVIEGIQANRDLLGELKVSNFTAGDAGSRTARRMLAERVATENAAAPVSDNNRG